MALTRELVASGEGLNQLRTAQYDVAFPEETNVELWIQWPWDLSAVVQESLVIAGVDLTAPTRYENGHIVISYVKRFPWLVVIAAVLITIGIAWAIWSLYKLVEVAGPAGVALGGGLIVVIGLSALYFLGVRLPKGKIT
jgi:hypothetical protein